MKKLTTKNYEVSKPSFNQYGASMTVYFKDESFMELDVDMSWNNRTDTVEIDTFHVDYYDQDDNVLEVNIVEVENMVIDICEHFNTFGMVEVEMEKAYHNDHRG